MSGKDASLPSLDVVRPILELHHGAAIELLAPLHRGFWSSAFGYRVDGADLVIRFASDGAGFHKDQAAFALNGRGLPIPEVVHIADSPVGG